MPLLNYTTKVPVARTLNGVHAALVAAGARQIVTEYDDAGTPSGVGFSIVTLHGPRTYALPVQAGRVYSVLRREKIERRYQTPEHAERVAWRIVLDWLEAQLAILRTEMVTFDQIMLPYMTTAPGTTVWDLYVAQQLALPVGDHDSDGDDVVDGELVDG